MILVGVHRKSQNYFEVTCYNGASFGITRGVESRILTFKSKQRVC